MPTHRIGHLWNLKTEKVDVWVEARWKVVADTRDFLKGKSNRELESLEECCEDLIALHSIGAKKEQSRQLSSGKGNKIKEKAYE